MKHVPFSVLILGLASLSSAQFLRAGSFAQVVSAAGNPSQTNEQGWVASSAPAILSRSASAVAGGGSAQTTFISEFGRLRGSTYAETSGLGPLTSSSTGTFADFNNFVGAAFFDSITLTGVGEVTININFSFHSVNVDPNENTLAESEFKFDTFSSIEANTHNVAKISHSGAGNRTNSGSVTITGPSGHKFDLLVALSGFSASRLPADVTNSYSASSDATNTALVTIQPVNGSFTSASGASYAEPVPEPATIAVLGMGMLALKRRRSAVMPL